MDLNAALDQFDKVEANIARITKIWDEMSKLIPQGHFEAIGLPDELRYSELRESYLEILKGLPPIDGWQITALPVSYAEIAQGRVDLLDVFEPSAGVGFEREVQAPGAEISTYRQRVLRQRRLLVRDRVLDLVGQIDQILQGMSLGDPDTNPRDLDEWDRLEALFGELSRLHRGQGDSRARWGDMTRHLAFGQSVDLHDIVEMDWPSVRAAVTKEIYSETEPVPVEVADLGSLVRSRPTGPVTIELAWDSLAPSDFERLVYELIRSTAGYVNAALLTNANAADRGRDLSADRVINDLLTGTRRERVIIQCKHWRSKSVGVPEISAAVAQMAFWKDPPVDVLVFATTGRFTADAISWVEQNNHSNTRLKIEMWPDSHLDHLLASRPDIVTSFKLR